MAAREKRGPASPPFLAHALRWSASPRKTPANIIALIRQQIAGAGGQATHLEVVDLPSADANERSTLEKTPPLDTRVGALRRCTNPTLPVNKYSSTHTQKPAGRHTVPVDPLADDNVLLFILDVLNRVGEPADLTLDWGDVAIFRDVYNAVDVEAEMRGRVSMDEARDEVAPGRTRNGRARRVEGKSRSNLRSVDRWTRRAVTERSFCALPDRNGIAQAEHARHPVVTAKPAHNRPHAHQYI